MKMIKTFNQKTKSQKQTHITNQELTKRMNTHTTIRIKPDTKRVLTAFKLIPRESYDAVLMRIIRDVYDVDIVMENI